MANISASVGKGGINRRQDVITVQTLINNHIRSIAPIPAFTVNGVADLKTIAAIEEFQRKVVKLARPDGRVDPNGRTLAALNGRASGTTLGAPQLFQYPVGPQEPLADIARPYIGATEATGNRMGDDPRMREIFEADSLAPNGQTDGYPWCCAFVSLCVQKLIAQSPFYRHVRPPRTASVSNFRTRWAPSQNCLIFSPADQQYHPHKGDVVVFTFSHIGIVSSVGQNQVRTIEGNTNAAGSREGTTVLPKDRAFGIIRCFIRLPLPVSYDFTRQMCVA
jgi:hypothetical protein